MGLPLPRVVPDVGPGGGLVTAMGGMNALANANILRQINAIKKQYAPQQTEADINSKNAYAQLVGLQPLGKILANQDAYSNITDEQKNAINSRFLSAGGVGPLPFPKNNNALNEMPGPQQTSGTGQPSTNSFSRRVQNAFHALIGNNPQQNPMQSRNPLSQSMQGTMGQQAPQQQQPNQNQPSGAPQTFADENGNNPAVQAYEAWRRSPEGQAELRKGDRANIPDERSVMQWAQNKIAQQQGNPTIEMDMTGGQRSRGKTNAEIAGEYQGTKEFGKEAGKLRAQAQNEIGKAQLALSNSGASLHRMASIIKNPVIQEMRSKIPFFQDKQLGYLEKMGTPEQKKLIGDFITTGEQIIASGVQAFGGKPLVREFDLLQRQKINRNDPIHVAEGKLQASIALHDIAEKKNEIINGLLAKGVNEVNAVRRANKMVDVSAIEDQTKNLLRDKPSEADIKYMAKKRGISVDEVRKRLKARGLM